MINFSNTLVINDQPYAFSFSEVKRINSSKYYVSVKGRNESVLAFEMKMALYNDNWVVCQPAPEWVLKKEAVFSNWIKQNRAHHTRFVVS
jgi:hypothetical protein